MAFHSIRFANEMMSVITSVLFGAPGTKLVNLQNKLGQAPSLPRSSRRLAKRRTGTSGTSDGASQRGQKLQSRSGGWPSVLTVPTTALICSTVGSSASAGNPPTLAT